MMIDFTPWQRHVIDVYTSRGKSQVLNLFNTSDSPGPDGSPSDLELTLTSWFTSGAPSSFQVEQASHHRAFPEKVVNTSCLLAVTSEQDMSNHIFIAKDGVSGQTPIGNADTYSSWVSDESAGVITHSIQDSYTNELIRVEQEPLLFARQ